MSSGSPVQTGGFSINDLLTRIIPGALFIIPAVIVFISLQPDLFTENRNLVLIGSAISAYIAGEIINIFRMIFLCVPSSLRWHVSYLTGREDVLALIYRKSLRLQSWSESLREGNIANSPWNYQNETLSDRLDFDFVHEYEDHFDIDLIDGDIRDIYDLLVMELEPNFSESTRRLKLLFEFVNNLKISAVFLVLLISYTYIQGINVGTSIYIISGLLVLMFVVTLLSLLLSVEMLYVESLLKEFYLLSVNKDQ
jgi:hypothetical protein